MLYQQKAQNWAYTRLLGSEKPNAMARVMGHRERIPNVRTESATCKMRMWSGRAPFSDRGSVYPNTEVMVVKHIIQMMVKANPKSVLIPG